jgi:hypothetical protein
MKISGKAKKYITTSKGGGFLSHIKFLFHLNRFNTPITNKQAIPQSDSLFVYYLKIPPQFSRFFGRGLDATNSSMQPEQQLIVQ